MTNDKYYVDYYIHGFITEDNDEALTTAILEISCS